MLKIHQMNGAPMAYMELTDGQYVMRFRYVTLCIGWKGKHSKTKPEALVKASKEAIKTLKARLLEKCGNEQLPVIIWRRRPVIEFYPREQLWMWSCRVTTSPPLDFLPWQKDEGMNPQIIEGSVPSGYSRA